MDCLFLKFTVSKVLTTKGQTVMLLFAFEFVIQLATICTSVMKYLFAMVDVNMEGRWESKGIFIFYLELVTDLVKLCVYTIFFAIVFSTYGIPIHLVHLYLNLNYVLFK